MMDRIADKFEHYMDLLSTRQKQVTSNIANADTPGYKARDIDFQFEFQSQVAGSRPNDVTFGLVQLGKTIITRAMKASSENRNRLPGRAQVNRQIPVVPRQPPVKLNRGERNFQ